MIKNLKMADERLDVWPMLGHIMLTDTEYTMRQVPLCQFGPGGDFVKAWPDYAAAVRSADEVCRATAEQASEMEPPLVSVGPEGIRWQKKAPAVSQTQARARETTGKAPAGPQGVYIPTRVVVERKANIGEVAMRAGSGPRIAAGDAYAVAAEARQEIDGDDGNSYAETVGDSEIHTGNPQESRLFADDAGNWGSSAIEQGYRVRARNGIGKKRRAAARRKAQSPLFADIA